MKRKIRLSTILLILLVLIIGAIFGYLTYQQNYLTFEYIATGVSLIVCIFLFISSLPSKRNSEYVQKLEDRLSLWNTISYKVKGAGETAFSELPIGVIVLDNNYRVVWSNNLAQKATVNNLKDKQLKEIANGILYDAFVKVENNDHAVERQVSIVELFDTIYEIEILKNERIIYLRDISKEKKINDLYHNHTLAFGYINLDNLEECLADLDVQSKSDYKAQLLTAIISWANRFNGYVQALSDSRFILMLNRENLIKMMNDKFSILDDIKLIVKTTKSFYITLSIGVACYDIPIVEITNMAQEMLELAFNRGGDQVVINIDNEIETFGAKTDPVHKESKVEIRFKYQELEDLITNASNVFCVGHKYQDADAFGSCMAMYSLAQALGKEVFIILDEKEIDNTVSQVYEDVKKQHPTIYSHIVSSEKALTMVDDRSLLIILDCQAQSQLFNNLKGKISSFKNIGIIDHHRKNESGTIDNPSFYFSDPAASSCVELIFTLLEFSNAELQISSSQATWMMLGMIVDTNNFTYRTSSTTFEIASILNRYQANIVAVKEYLKEDKNEKLLRNKFLSNVEIYNEVAGIVVQKEYEPVAGELISKVSDDALSIRGLKVALTCGYIKDNNTIKIKISARSLGEINCQMIMEKLGGGGHLTSAAVTLDNRTMEDVVAELKRVLDTVLVASLTTRVLLLTDIRGKGKAGELVEYPTTQANQVINSGLAIIATLENVRIYEEEKKERAAAEKAKKQESILLKKRLEEKPFKIYVDTNEDGALIESVSTKSIGDVIESSINERIDRRKIEITTPIDKLGSYNVEVKLDEEIDAVVKIYVIEKK